MNDVLVWIFFFFSSRRRHTRCYRDWSSDVCSSDLLGGSSLVASPQPCSLLRMATGTRSAWRSEERRVGKEGRSRWSPDHLKDKIIEGSYVNSCDDRFCNVFNVYFVA